MLEIDVGAEETDGRKVGLLVYRLVGLEVTDDVGVFIVGVWEGIELGLDVVELGVGSICFDGADDIVGAMEGALVVEGADDIVGTLEGALVVVGADDIVGAMVVLFVEFPNL